MLQNGFRLLRFPDPLEQQFRRRYRMLAISHLISNTPYLAFLFFLLGLLTFSPSAEQDIGLFPVGYAIAIISLFSLLILVRQPRFDRLFHGYAGISTMISLAALMTVANTVTDPALRTGAHAAVIFAVILFYAMAKMRFYTTVFWALMAGLTHWLACLWLDLSPTFQEVQAYFITANLIGMGITYIIEQRERSIFLQALLLDIDKAEQQRLYNNLEKLAREDPLTGLANRRYFDERLRMEWSRCQREQKPLSLVLLDIDFFKQYNDLYGHQAGDLCLTMVARALQKEASRPAELVGRYGGEEFIILYPNVDIGQIKKTLLRIQQRIMDQAIPHEASRAATVVTASLGAATVYPVPALHPEKLVSAADQMLYKSKESGRNCWFNTLISHCEPQQQSLINLS